MNPEYVEVNGTKYKINTNFKVGLKCEKTFKQNDISPYEKFLAIIYMLFGDKGLENRDNYCELYDLGIKYLLCNEEKEETNEKPDMDFEQDYRLIKASFRTDYGINIDEEDLSWWDFCTYLNGLKEDSILNRIREIRTYNPNKIDNIEERTKFIKMKNKVALKDEQPKPNDEQQKNAEKFWKEMGL